MGSSPVASWGQGDAVAPRPSDWEQDQNYRPAAKPSLFLFSLLIASLFRSTSVPLFGSTSRPGCSL